ncbi:hypothetical protein Tco_1219662 [Tanacetum coccineum]
MAEPIFYDIEKAPTESNLSITSNDIKIELNKEFLVELQRNIYHGTYNDDVVDHIAKPMMLKNGELVREMEKSPLGRNLLRNSSVDSILNHTIEKMKCWMKERTRGLIDLNSYQTNKRYVDNSISNNNEWKESKHENPSNTTTNSFFKAYDIHDIEKEIGQGKLKQNNEKDDKRPHKKNCTTEKFEAIK